MVKIKIDLPIVTICTTDIEMPPLKQLSSTVITQLEQANFCLPLAILLVVFGYLLYLHLFSLYTVHNKNLFRELDLLDIAISLFSIIRLATLFFFPIVSHESGIVALAIFGFLWEFILALIYVKFLTDDRRKWVNSALLMIVIYLVYAVVVNYFKKSKEQQAGSQLSNGVIIPIFYANIVMTIGMTTIALIQFISIQKVLTERVLTSNITIQLKNRRSFIFMTTIACWVSLIMRRFPEVFKPILGVVLYFVICQLFNMAVVYKSILYRIVKSNEQSEDTESYNSIQNDGPRNGNNKRNSATIVVEMRNLANY